MQYVINALVKVKTAALTAKSPFFPVTTTPVCVRCKLALMDSDKDHQNDASGSYYTADSEFTSSAPSFDTEDYSDEERSSPGPVDDENHPAKSYFSSGERSETFSAHEGVNYGNNLLSYETVSSTNEDFRQREARSYFSFSEAANAFKSNTASRDTKESQKSTKSSKKVSWKDDVDGNHFASKSSQQSELRYISSSIAAAESVNTSSKALRKTTLPINLVNSRSTIKSAAIKNVPVRMVPPLPLARSAVNSLTGVPAGSVIKKNADVNVLLLGESGVGKSTWINSILNYLGRKSFDDALNRKKLFTPCKTVTDKGNRKLFVDYETSKTHYKPRSYAFQRNGHVYHFVDGPSVSTTFGPLKDRRNMDQLLQVFASFDHFNAICFLIEADCRQLSDAFRFCLVDLLTVLPPSAMNNVFFCFTKSASTGFIPGNGVICLNELLTEYRSMGYLDSHFDVHMEHFMDNELLEHLASTHIAAAKCLQNWDISCSMTKEFLDEIAGLKPIDCVDVRRNFTANRLLRNFISHYRSARHETRTARSDYEKIKPCASGKLFDASEETVTRHLICTSRKCTGVYPIVGGGVARVYAACHNDCHHKNAEACAAKARTRLDICRGCGCDWKFHAITDKKVVVRELGTEDLRAAERCLVSAMDVEAAFLNICLSLVHMFYGRSCCKMNHAYTDYLTSASVGQSEIEELSNTVIEWKLLKKVMGHYEDERLNGQLSTIPIPDFGWLRKRFDWLKKHNVDTNMVAFFLDMKIDLASRHVSTSC